VSEDKLKEFFLKYYTSIIGTKIIVDPVNKTSKGYGFVKFSDYIEAQRAVSEMNGKYLNGKSIKTK
jgi:RNA recognition motif-containing protein